MASLQRSSVVSRHPDLLEANVGDDIVLLSVEQANYYALDPVAAAVWQRLERPTTVEALCADLVSEFEVTLEQCEAEVMRFLTELDGQHLLVVHA
jgi:hypothetical protein